MALILGRYPLEYRSEVVSLLMASVQRGDSACVVGIAGTGKSNLVHFLAQAEVKQHYLPAGEASRTHFVPLSCLPGIQPKDSIFEAMNQWAWEIAKGLNQELEDRSPAGVAPLQVLRGVLRMTGHGLNQRLVFVFDEFECLIRHQSPGFLDDLRTLRDDHRTSGNLVFIVLTHRLPQVVPGLEPLRASKFFGVIRDHIYPLTPYREADSQGMLDFLLQKEGNALRIPAQIRKRLIFFSGGHPALLGALFEELKPEFGVAAFTASTLPEKSRIRDVCADIWQNLHTEEQVALCAIVQDQAIDPEMKTFLCRRGLLLNNPSSVFFSPLFRGYVERHQLRS
jgi:hypothetical protein